MIRKRTTLTTTERRQRLFCLLFGCILLGTAWGMVMLRWQYDGVPTGWAGFLGMFFRPSLLFRHSGRRAQGTSCCSCWRFFCWAFRLWDSLLRGCCC